MRVFVFKIFVWVQFVYSVICNYILDKLFVRERNFGKIEIDI